MTQLRPNIITAPPGPKGQEIIRKDDAHGSPSYIKAYPLVVDRGEGVWVYDVDGNRYLDLMAGIATASTGHSHPQVVQAIKDQAEKFLHICGTDFYYQSLADVIDRLASYVPGMGPKKVFLSNSGSESVDGAIKLVRYHTKRQNIISFKGAFHGRTIAAISMNQSKVKYRAGFGPLMPGVYHVPYPASDPHRDEAHRGESEDYAMACLEPLADLFARTVAPHEVAAIFIEPILGEGGYVLPPRAFLQGLRELCDEYGIMLVFDEVQCGVGRTGHMYACEHYGVYPDVLLSAKGIASGMPLGAIIAKEHVMSWTTGTHGSTYGGNPVACAAAMATFDVVEGLLPQVREVGGYLLEKLRGMQSKFPVLADVRGVGLMIGAEFLVPGTSKPASKFVEEIESEGFKRGLLMLSCGKSTIRFAPPLVLTKGDVDVAIELLDELLTDLCARHDYPVH